MLTQLFVQTKNLHTPTPCNLKLSTVAPSPGIKPRELPVLCIKNVNSILLMPQLLSKVRTKTVPSKTLRSLTDS